MPTRVHFLHIGKTGGNALRATLAPLMAERGIVWHGHQTNLHDIPEGEQVVFFVRDPVARYVSGFNGRLRRDLPNQFCDWEPAERASFALFPNPNALAEALASPDGMARIEAEHAMRSIAHVRKPLAHFLTSADYVESRRDDILLIGFQETLEDDFQRLKQRLGLPAGLGLPRDPVVAHRMPPSFAAELSPAGRAAIEAWYARDIDLYRALLSHRPAVRSVGRA